MFFRDSYVRKVQRQEDVRKVRQEIDHQQENDYRNKEQDQGKCQHSSVQTNEEPIPMPPGCF